MAVLAEASRRRWRTSSPSAKRKAMTPRTRKLARHGEVSAVLMRDARLILWGIRPILIGSFAPSVSIRRIKDVDVLGG